MSARNDTLALMGHLNRNGIAADFDDANTLRRAQIALHRWAELECGDGNDHMSWSIERDDATNIPYRCVYPHRNGIMRRYRIADKEAGALRRVAAICKRLGVHFYHQGDPRGCALYVSAEPIKDNDYTRGIACSI
jgi:hypothetical protein